MSPLVSTSTYVECKLRGVRKLAGVEDHGFSSKLKTQEHIQKYAGMVEKGEKRTVLNWPAMNFDFSPAENLHGVLKSTTGKRNPANIPELEHTAKEEWKEIAAETCKKVTDACKKRNHRCRRGVQPYIKEGGLHYCTCHFFFLFPL